MSRTKRENHIGDHTMEKGTATGLYHSLSVDLCLDLGGDVVAALIMQHIQINVRNRLADNILENGVPWFEVSYVGICNYMFELSPKQVEFGIKRLKECGLIKVVVSNKKNKYTLTQSGWDYYPLTEEEKKKINIPVAEAEEAKSVSAAQTRSDDAINKRVINVSDDVKEVIDYVSQKVGKHIDYAPSYIRNINSLFAAGYTKAGSTLKFTFIPAVTELATRYVNFYKSDGSTVQEFIDVNANDGVVEIPLIGKDGTKYYGVKCALVFDVGKSENLRMESSNSVVEGKTTYFYYKDTRSICFPFYNPTQFDAYILMSGCYVPNGTYGQHFHCISNNRYISVSKSLGYATTSEVGFNFNGLEGTACTWDNKLSKIKKVYAGLSGTLLVIPGGGRHELEVDGVSSFKNIQIAPMYYRI